MPRWLLPVAAVLVGAMIGLGVFTFGYARGYSYISNDPAACANCHIMDDHYSAWQKSSHSAVATCNDCHTPHEPVSKYAVKARNGFWHSFYFTTGGFPYPLRITPPNHDVVEEGCRYCHGPITEAIEHGAQERGSGEEASGETLVCTRCHRHVGHWIR